MAETACDGSQWLQAIGCGTHIPIVACSRRLRGASGEPQTYIAVLTTPPMSGASLSTPLLQAGSKASHPTVLVAGGAGYIGSHVCKALAEAGVAPVCYDTLEKGHAWAVKWGPLEQGDIGDKSRLDEVLGHYTPAAIIHLAGYIEVGESVREPDRYWQNNVAKSEILIEACLRHGVPAMVFSSTCAVYGLPTMEVLAEDHPLAPLNPYAKSKAEIEGVLVHAAKSGLRSVSLRYFNATGADADGTIGEAHNPETHLLPLAADAVLGLGPPLTILGADYPTPDGSCIRDFVHVSDLAQAHLSALRWMTNAPSDCHEVFNLGGGTGYSVREVLVETERIAGRPVPYTLGPRRPGDSPRLVANFSKASAKLGWAPTRDLATQIEDTLRWRRSMPRRQP